jgi:hypothetical protein
MAGRSAVALRQSNLEKKRRNVYEELMITRFVCILKDYNNFEKKYLNCYDMLLSALVG